MSSAAIDDVLVLVQARRRGAPEAAERIVAWLEGRSARVRTEHDGQAYCTRRKSAREEGLPLDDPPGLVVVLGGDGAILGAARAFAEEPVLTVGVNFGHVGFLASTPQTRWEETLASVFEGAARVEHRMRLEATWTERGRPQRAIALNEVVLQRGTHQRMLSAAMRVGDDHVTTYRADGLILATPSGSTAYSLSAGGPILQPTLEGVVVTPICSQGLSNRPLVLNADQEIRVRVTSSDGTTSLLVDGQISFGLASGQEVVVRRHAVPYPLVAMPDLDPFRRLRERLGWSGGPSVVASDADPHAADDDPFPPQGTEGGRY